MLYEVITLVGAREDVRHLGHEVHTAEDDVFGAGIGRLAREFQRVAAEIGVLKHLVALVVMAQDNQSYNFV